MTRDETDVPDDVAAAPDPAFRALLERLSERYHFDFREYKGVSLMRRIRARMSQVRVPDFEAYESGSEQKPKKVPK